MENAEKKDKVMRTSLVVLVAVVVIFAGALIFAGKKASVNDTAMSNNNSYKPVAEEKLKNAIVSVGGNHLVASVASSDRSRARGLSGVTSIGPNEGKMFTFEEEGYWEIWAKEMKFNFDIIWINDAGTVVDFVENVSPDTYPNSFKPRYPASKVLETNAGWVKENNIKAGDVVMSTEMK